MKIRTVQSGLTMTELVISMAMSTVIVLTAGVLLVSAQKSWNDTYNFVHRQINQDAQKVMLTLGAVGRKSNRLSYQLYEVDGNLSFSPAVPDDMDGTEVVFADAVEFRYWNSGFSEELLDVEKKATSYALFYIQESVLKVDYGPYPPGAVPGGSGSKNSSDVVTAVLANNVVPNTNGAFSHTTTAGKGGGSIRIDVTLNDTENNESIQVMTTTFMRNIWPK